MTTVTATITKLAITERIDGSMVVVLYFSEYNPLSRTHMAAGFLLALMRTLGVGAFIVGDGLLGLACRVQFENDEVMKIGHPHRDVWTDFAEPEVADAMARSRSRYDGALGYINNHRALRALRDLVPDEAGWSETDVFIEADRLGWSDD